MKNLRTSETLKYRISVLLFAAVIVSAALHAQVSYDAWKSNICLRIDSLLGSDVFQTSQAGVCIYDLTSDKTLYSHNGQQTMRPASTQKVITAVTALYKLGADHRIYTSVYHTGSIMGHTLYGNVYCVGSLDPLLDETCLTFLAQEIKSMGISTINGSIFLDSSMKDENKLGEGWCWDDENPTLYALTIDGRDNFSEKFVRALEEEGVVLFTSLDNAKCPEDAILLCRTYHTVSDILQDMLKKSNNFHAESLFYNIAASTGKSNANAKDAANIISSLAENLGHDRSEYRIADGSGLSLYNYTTPEILVDFLKYAYKNTDIYKFLYEALPIAGVDGTLRRRMKQYKNTCGNVHAKTGSVSCVSSLAGFCKASNGHDIAFAIINQGILRSKKARKFQDDVCAILCEPINTKLNK